VVTPGEATDFKDGRKLIDRGSRRFRLLRRSTKVHEAISREFAERGGDFSTREERQGEQRSDRHLAVYSQDNADGDVRQVEPRELRPRQREYRRSIDVDEDAVIDAQERPSA
jgi:hypothetical protein